MNARPTTPNSEDLTLIRRRIIQRRARLSGSSQEQAARRLAKQAVRCHELLQARRVLSYVPFRGEISPCYLPLNNSTQVYLPRIINFRTRKMMFFDSTSPRQKNRYGIDEPMATDAPVFANQLDIILLPLVAFDRAGNRLGMGAGYYDRALQSLTHQHGTRPLLVGLAHHFQEINAIKANAWDVPLNAILTDQEYIRV